MYIYDTHQLRDIMSREESNTQKIIMYKKELAKLHQRVRLYIQKTQEFHKQIELIQRIDWIKYELIQIGGANRAFKWTIEDIRYKDQLEDLFGVEFDLIPALYQAMLEKRNLICHKYTSGLWLDKAHPKPSHSVHLIKLLG